jgi:ATP-dependent Clp protease protease subunit
MNISDYYEQSRINLTGPVNEKMIEDLDRQVKAISPEESNSEDQSVVLTLASGGGSVGYARVIYEELGLLQNRFDLNFVARGICLSAAVTIAMAFPRERRFATPNTKFLIHEGSRDSTPQIVGPLSAREIQLANAKTSHKDDIEEDKWVMGVIAKGCSRPLRELKKQARGGLWLVGKKAVEFGLVDSLLDSRSK